MHLRVDIVDQRQQLTDHLLLVRVAQAVHLIDPDEGVRLDFGSDAVTGSHVLEMDNYVNMSCRLLDELTIEQ